MEEEKTITITEKEYKELRDRDRLLCCLEAAGVDNWDWYGDALEEYQKGEK